MADADEDVIPTAWSQIGEEELEDDAQDFRFIAQLASSSSSGQPQSTIPKRGTKDFEPNTTHSQANTLNVSRSAMHNALSAIRIHNSKSHVVGQYLPNEKDWKWEGFNARCVVVEKFKSTHGKSMGQADFRNWVWFLPEEALYLLERGSLDIRWPDLFDLSLQNLETDGQDSTQSQLIEEKSKTSQEEKPAVSGPWNAETDEGDQGDSDANAEAEICSNATERTAELLEGQPKVGEFPMSLQGAYASFMGKNGLSLERYVVYASLKRLGYIVQRAATWHVEENFTNGSIDSAASSTLTLTSKTTALVAKNSSRPGNPAISLIYTLISWLFNAQRHKPCPSIGPLISTGLYRNYNDIFRDLALTPYHNSSEHREKEESLDHDSNKFNPNPTPHLRISFDVWKPNAKYRKSAPQPPDYRVAIIDARSSTVPTMEQIGQLLDSMPTDELPSEKRIEARLKYGKRNVLLAIVDGGVISYMRFSDAEFGSAKLYEERKSVGRGGGGGGGFKKGRGGGKSKGKGVGRGKVNKSA